MAKGLMDRVLGIIGFEEESVDEKDLEEYEETPVKKRGAVVSLHTQRQMRVVVVEPRVFEEVQGIADNLKNHRPVIMNLEKVDADLARRVVDFVGGATYALNGSMQKIGSGIFISVPDNVDIASELKEKQLEGEVFPWTKL